MVVIKNLPVKINAMLLNILNKYLSVLKINIDESAINLLLSYWKFLLEKNNTINLISRQGTMESRIVNHLIDSLTPLVFNWPKKLCVMDFGSGAGLPGIPLKICQPDWRMTLVESTQKKANFLSEACAILKLKNCSIVNSYIDNKYNFNNKKFNLITIRAVGKLNDLIKNVNNFLEINGIILAYKGPNYISEIKNIKNISNKINIKLVKTYSFTLPYIEAERNLLFFVKYK
jgi:16S rRNA (guanine527-N7)-methyltransferase